MWYNAFKKQDKWKQVCWAKEKFKNFSSFEKQKSMFWHFSETRIKRQTDIKKIITSANETDKAHFKRV